MESGMAGEAPGEANRHSVPENQEKGPLMPELIQNSYQHAGAIEIIHIYKDTKLFSHFKY